MINKNKTGADWETTKPLYSHFILQTQLFLHLQNRSNGVRKEMTHLPPNTHTTTFCIISWPVLFKHWGAQVAGEIWRRLTNKGSQITTSQHLPEEDWTGRNRAAVHLHRITAEEFDLITNLRVQPELGDAAEALIKTTRLQRTATQSCNFDWISFIEKITNGWDNVKSQRLRIRLLSKHGDSIKLQANKN